MVTVLARHKTQYPPIGPLRLNPGHPLSIGMVCGLVCNSFGSSVIFDPISGASLLYNGTPSWGVAGAATIAGFINNTAPSGAEVTAPNSVRLQYPMTMVWKGYILGNGTLNGEIFGVAANNADSSPFISYGLGWDGSTSGQLRLECNNGSFQATVGFTTTTGSHFIACTYATGLQNLYIDDPTLVRTTLNISGTITYGATALLHLGAHTGPGGRNPNVVHEYGYIYNRVLTTAELAAIQAEPYAMWADSSVQRWSLLTTVPLPPGLGPSESMQPAMTMPIGW